MSTDQLQRLLLEDINARSVVVHLDRVIDEVLGRSHYPEPVAGLLSEALLVAALCSSGIKFSGRISVQLRSTGPLKLLLADCTHDGGLRGIARFDENDILGARTFRELTEGGVLTFTVEPGQRGQVWQGIVPLSGDGLAEAVAGYFDQSEQLPSLVRLSVAGRRAAGMLIQRMPGSDPESDDWNRLEHLMATVGDAELLATNSETMLQRLFHADRRRLFPARELRFHCPCTRERVATMLRGLGSRELETMIESQSEVEVSCEFCNELYVFDRLDIRGLLLSDLPDAGGGETLH